MGLIGHDGGGGPARATAAAGLVAAALALLPAAAAAAPADRAAIAYTDFETIKAVGEAGGTPAALGAGAEPAWSPDGRAIAYFTGPLGGPYTGISIANPDGSGARRALAVVTGGIVVTLSATGQVAGILTNFDLSGVTDPERLSGLSWSPDGRELRFAVLQPEVTLLVGLDVTTGATTRLGDVSHQRGAVPRGIAWSPAGRLVAFAAPVTAPAGRRCRAGERRIFTYRLGDAAARRVPLRGHRCAREVLELHSPTFSPDGTRLVVTRLRPEAAPARHTDLQTFVVGPRGRVSGRMRPTAPGLVNAHSATFSPDGQMIAYLFNRPGADGIGGLGVMRADGTGRRDLLSAPFLVLQHPDWGYAPRP